MKVRAIIKAQPPPPDIPTAPHYYKVVKDFKGLNTKADRTAIEDVEFSWIENIQPVGRANLQAVPNYLTLGITWTSPVASWFSFSAITLTNATHDYLIAFETDGRMEVWDITGNAAAGSAAAATFSTSGVTFCMWSDTTPVIVDPAKGLFYLKLTNTGFALVQIGSVGLTVVNAGGSGYTSAPAVAISAPGNANGVQATAIATVVSGAVTSVTLTEAGSGYTATPTITLTGGGGTGATAIASLVNFATGIVANVLVQSGGTLYTSAPTVVFTGGGGTGAAGTAVLLSGAVALVVITNGGTGYTSAPTVSFTGGGGSGAIAIADVQAAPNVSVASFSGRIWVAAGRTVNVSAAGSYRDFISVSSTSIVLTDETLRGAVVRLFAANNFLYVFGTDSINVFSDVTVDSNGSTLFTNTVVSSSIGTIFPDAIFSYYRSVLFMNQYGVYALVGATASKVSDALDGLFKRIIFFLSLPTCGQCVINNELCAAFNFLYYDPVTLTARWLQAIFFDKKWWLASQGGAVTRILSAETGGNLIAYGTSSTNTVQLFADATTSQPQTIQTALWPMEDVMMTKQALRAGVELRTSTQAAPINLTIDNENTSTAVQVLYNAIQWVNDDNEIIQWMNNSGAVVDWITTGYQLYETDAAQFGKYLGLTITAQLPNIVLTGTEIEYMLRERWR